MLFTCEVAHRGGRGSIHQSGQAVVEAALVFSVFIVAVLGFTDLGRAIYTYNGISNLAREATHYASTEFTSDSSSACYYKTYNQSNCQAAVASYINGLGMVAGLSPSSLTTTVSAACTGGCNPIDPITVSLSAPFQPVSTSLIGLGANTITGTSTDQFIIPPNVTATPNNTPVGVTATPGPVSTVAPTPTVTSEAAPPAVTVTPTGGCTKSCLTYTVSWTLPPDTAQLGHFDIWYVTGTTYTYIDTVPGNVGGSTTTSDIITLSSGVDAVCAKVYAVYDDGGNYSTVGRWRHDSSTGWPSC